MTDPRYPIGPFEAPEQPGEADVRQWLAEIRRLPDELRRAVGCVSPEELDRPYRPGGWTRRQVVHHIADSHTHGYLRIKSALAEDDHVAAVYDENRFMAIGDWATTPVELNLDYIDHLHGRLVGLIESLHPQQLARSFTHPEMGRVTVVAYVARLAWHGRHHTGHVGMVRMEEQQPNESRATGARGPSR